MSSDDDQIDIGDAAHRLLLLSHGDAPVADPEPRDGHDHTFDFLLCEERDD